MLTIGRQITEALETHKGMSARSEAKKRAIELLELVGIPSADERINDYPHQFSGGMRQRAMIAMALSCEPSLLIADEPTTALDVTIQAQILELLRRLRDRARDGRPDHHPRPGRGRRLRRPARGHVRGPDRGDRPDRGRSWPTRPPLHGRPAALAAAPGPAAPGGPDADRGLAARTSPSSLEGCPFAPRCGWRLDALLDGRPAARRSPVANGSRMRRCARPPASPATTSRPATRRSPGRPLTRRASPRLRRPAVVAEVLVGRGVTDGVRACDQRRADADRARTPPTSTPRSGPDAAATLRDEPGAGPAAPRGQGPAGLVPDH